MRQFIKLFDWAGFILLMVGMLVGSAWAIDWRGTLDQVNTNIDDTTENGGMLRLYQIDTMKEVEQQRAIAEQMERVADLMVVQQQQNLAIQAMFATTIVSNSNAFRELVTAVQEIAAQ